MNLFCSITTQLYINGAYIQGQLSYIESTQQCMKRKMDAFNCISIVRMAAFTMVPFIYQYMEYTIKVIYYMLYNLVSSHVIS